MSRNAVNRILRTIQVYVSNEYDGLYVNTKILDELCDELKAAVHCDECCSRNCEEELEE